jgi:lipopolysaccharide export system permease protein
MKTLHRYLTTQVLLTLIMTVAVFTFVLLLVNVLKEILTLLVARQITLPVVFKAIGLLLPYIMTYVLPFGMLTAMLLVFGRFSADQELTAIRASGISLISMITPLIVLSLGLSLLCGVINLWLAPQSRAAYRTLIYQLGSRNITSLITEDRFIDEIPGLIFYTRKKDGDELEDVRIYTIETNQIKTRISAERGRIIWNPGARQISFELQNALSEFKNEKPKVDPNLIGPPVAHPEEIPEWGQAFAGMWTTEPYDLTPLFRSDRKLRIGDMTIGQLIQERANLKAKGISDSPARVQMHRRVSFSFACVGFTLVGIPLAIRAHRRETSIGIAISLLLVAMYYSFFILADAFSAREKLHPELILWIPNFLFQGIGAFLLHRANKGG